jgi:hypothetical protein
MRVGGMPERPKGAVCKIAGVAYGGSNPPPPTSRFVAPTPALGHRWPHFGHSPRGDRAEPLFDREEFMPGTPLRFAVGSPEEQCSSVWRLWTNRSDAYLASRMSARSFKLSMHERRTLDLRLHQRVGSRIPGHRVTSASELEQAG